MRWSLDGLMLRGRRQPLWGWWVSRRDAPARARIVGVALEIWSKKVCSGGLVNVRSVGVIDVLGHKTVVGIQQVEGQTADVGQKTPNDWVSVYVHSFPLITTFKRW